MLYIETSVMKLDDKCDNSNFSYANFKQYIKIIYEIYVRDKNRKSDKMLNIYQQESKKAIKNKHRKLKYIKTVKMSVSTKNSRTGETRHLLYK